MSLINQPKWEISLCNVDSHLTALNKSVIRFVLTLHGLLDLESEESRSLKRLSTDDRTLFIELIVSVAFGLFGVSM